MPSLLERIALLEMPGVGRRTVLGMEENDARAPRLFPDIRRMRPPDKFIRRAEGILANCRKRGIEVIARGDRNYPERFRDMSDPPVVLYALGRTACLHRARSVAVVGTRRPTREGTRFGRAFGQALASAGISVVSGLALGCDTAAHEGCLKGGGETIACLPAGLGHIYPPANRSLAKRILGGKGCLLTEYPPFSPPRNYTFIERDRLQSALSDAVVIVETDLAGGAMHTARFCLEQKRQLACLSAEGLYATHRMRQGNAYWIRRGKAISLAGMDDFLKFTASFGKVGRL